MRRNFSWNDTENNQDNSSDAFGKMVLKPFAKIAKGTAVVDGARLGMINWYDTTNTCWSTPAAYGTAKLAAQ